MNIEKIIKLTNFYYKFAAQLSRYVEEDLPNAESIPPIEEFEKYYGENQHNYRIIYIQDSLDISSLSSLDYNKSVSIEQYKAFLTKKLKNMLSGWGGNELSQNQLEYIIKNPGSINYSNYSDLNKQHIKKLMNILSNFDDSFSATPIFSHDAINVLAPTGTKQDLSPIGLDHDIGHNIIDNFSQRNTDYKQLIEEAVNLDYQCFKVDSETGQEIESLSMLDLQQKFNFLNISELLVYVIIVTNNPIVGSISANNISNDILEDFSPDLFVIFNKNKGSFDSININPVTTYIDENTGMMSLNQMDKKGKYNSYVLKPSNNLTNVKKVIFDMLKKLSDFITERLYYLKGRIITTIPNVG